MAQDFLTQTSPKVKQLHLSPETAASGITGIAHSTIQFCFGMTSTSDNCCITYIEGGWCKDTSECEVQAQQRGRANGIPPDDPETNRRIQPQVCSISNKQPQCFLGERGFEERAAEPEQRDHTESDKSSWSGGKAGEILFAFSFMAAWKPLSDCFESMNPAQSRSALFHVDV
ncbi:unnamed protein product [Pleuronectes platessa]|uniref:Uncharacterized protein n=1 Tax=Pleuronectes platessa TaxID=8262 RepID=A0A9N7V064_PLEPL|nr:unnamed protein product [Pleuronectes platessa]